MEQYDNYLPCENYLNQPVYSKDKDFVKFFDESSQNFYFALISTNGQVLLKSEGYPKEKSCDNGIKSVNTNRFTEYKYAVIDANGIFYLSLKAGNKKEIARSCNFNSADEANAFLKSSLGITENNAVAIQTNVAENLSSSIIGSFEGYLPLDNYYDKERIWDSFGITGYAKFVGNDGKFYFVVYNPDASIYLMSKGYDSEYGRDDIFNITESVILLEEHYKIEMIDGGYYVALVDYDDSVLAISTKFDSFINAFVTTPAGRPKDSSIGTIY